jgi:O-6-methylguanine DNA methyltransferase
MKSVLRSGLRGPRSALVFKTSLGWIGLAASPRGVTNVILPLRARRRAEQSPSSIGAPNFAALAAARRQIAAFLAGSRRTFDVPLDLAVGTAFQRRVWRAATQIPFGQVRSYRWLAGQVGGTRYARAVGNALGANPVPLIVPCHRIVASDGSLGGFSCGLPIKRRLLALEGSLRQLGKK